MFSQPTELFFADFEIEELETSSYSNRRNSRLLVVAGGAALLFM
jgi:hypothetical protein